MKENSNSVNIGEIVDLEMVKDAAEAASTSPSTSRPESSASAPSANGSSVSGRGRRGAYHHGDLRAAAIAAGMQMLREGDGLDLGLRALAREVGVSATALYRHFPDKESLLDALAAEGIRRLGTLQAAAWKQAGGGTEAFRAIGVAYVRFAHDEPAVFRLSFTRKMPERAKDQEDDGVDQAYHLLRTGVAEIFPVAHNLDHAALHAWALVHGLAMLVLDQRVEWNEAMVADIVGMTFGVMQPE